MEYRYFVVPEWNSIFKVKEGCCYEKVVYKGPEIGITGKIDHEGDILNSWDLICFSCDPSVVIIPTTETYYNWKLSLVYDRLKSKAA